MKRYHGHTLLYLHQRIELGSGRISGLAWARGLVELEDGPRSIRPGDLVRYLPFAEFGL